MKARTLGLMATSTVFGLVASATTAYAQDGTSPAAAGPTLSAQAAVVEVISPARAALMGRDLLKNPDPKRAGPGSEQPVFGTHVDAQGNQFVTTVFMASADRDVQPQKAHMTLMCSSYQMHADKAPTLVAEKVIQAEEGRRTAHHPCMPRKADDKGRFLVGYGNDVNQNSPSHYVTIVDHMCNKLATPTRVSVDYKIDDGNSGACSQFQPYKGPNGETRYLGTYLVTNAQIDAVIPGAEMNDDDISYATNLKIEETAGGPQVVQDWWGVPAGATRPYLREDNTTDPPTLVPLTLTAKDNPAPVITPADIGRPHLRLLDNDRFVLCSSYGQNRPSDHIKCAVGKNSTGELLWQGFVLKGEENTPTMRHWNQVTIDVLSPNKIALHALAGNGGGKNTDIKGSSIGYTLVFDVVGDALVESARIKGAAVHQPHSAICTGKRGVEGQEKDTIFLVSQAHTGIGRAAGTLLSYDAAAKSIFFDEKKDKVPTAWYGDGQLMSNMFGENPMEQGRNYSTCIGDVPNPGYKKDNGWMKNVKSFFVTGVNGRQPGFARNAFWMSFVPAVTDIPVAGFSNPAPADIAATPPAADPTPAPAAKSESSSGCGCSTPGQTNSSNFAGGLLLLGLAIGGIAARRRS